MIAKKSKKADLERKRFAFFQIGLLVSGSLCLAAFEYTTAYSEKELAVVQFEEQEIDLSEQVKEFKIIEEELPKPQPKTTQVFSLDVDSLIGVDKEIQSIITKKGPNIRIDENDLKLGDGEFNFEIADPIDPPVDFPDKEPEFVGGTDAMYEWIGNKIEFPELCREMGLSGAVFITFVVEKDGSISSVQDSSGDDVHPDFIKEGKRVVRMMPNWIPGESMGKPVRVRYTLPIKFNPPR